MDLDRRPHLDFYTSLVMPDTRSLLDLGCGTGPITLAIAAAMSQGSRVTGVDLSPAMIRIAQHRAPQHVWKVGNLCVPPVTGPFDLITVCFHTLQVLTDPDDLGRCLAAVAGLLAPAGRFAFDIYRPNTAWLAAVSPGPHLARQFQDGTDRLIDVIESEAHYDATSRVLSGLWHLRDNATGEDLGVEPLQLRVRQYFPDDIAAAPARAGLRTTEAWGDLDRSPFAEGARRQVCVCRKV